VNPLTAIRQYLTPDLVPIQPARAQAQAPSAIPAAELQAVAPPPLPQALRPAGAAGADFGSMLGQMVEDVNARQYESRAATQGLLSGQDVPLHQAVVAMEEASVSFQLMVEVRNKLLESYQELMRMQI
jgi:flagellar hook-basal body complex protein FliE